MSRIKTFQMMHAILVFILFESCAKMPNDLRTVERDLIVGIGVKIPRVSGAEPKVGRVAEYSDGRIIEIPATAGWEGEVPHPWSRIRVCNLRIADSGLITIYSGDPRFSVNGLSGDVMVEIPLHYVKRTISQESEIILVSMEQRRGYELDSAFVENGSIREKIYIGAYEGYIEGGELKSISGVHPTNNLAITEAREYAKSKGSGFSIFDLRCLMMLQRLWLIEQCTRDSQSIYNGITGLLYVNEGKAVRSLHSSNSIIIAENNVNKLKIGVTVGLALGSDIRNYKVRKVTRIDSVIGGLQIYLDGDPFNSTIGITQIFCVPQPTGRTNYISSLSGAEAGDPDKASFKYLGIENLWGNMWKFVDGVKMVNSDTFVKTERGNWEQLGYKNPIQPQNTSEVGIFISKMGFDDKMQQVMLPEYLNPSAENNKDYCDPFYSFATGEFYAVHGGGWDHYYRAGLFCMRIWYKDREKNILNGARLIYR